MSGVSSELFVAHKLIEHGCEIFFPLMTQSRVDFVAMKEGLLAKIQVKKASWSKSHNHQYLQARLHGKSKRNPEKAYTEEDVDYFAITDNKRVWFIPFEEIGHQMSICLDCTNPKYKPQTKYNASDWLLENNC